MVRSLYLLSDTPFSSYFFPASAWNSVHGIQSLMTSNKSPSHRLPFFMNWYSMGPFHGMQSFRNGMLLCGYPIRLQVFTENLFLHGCSSPWATGPLSILLQHGLPLRCSFLSGPLWPEGFHRLQCGYLFHCGPLRAEGGQHVSPHVTTGSGEKQFSSSLSISSPLLLWP